MQVSFENLSLLLIRRVHGENPWCTVFGEMHSVGAHIKTLISDTAKAQIDLGIYNYYFSLWISNIGTERC